MIEDRMKELREAVEQARRSRIAEGVRKAWKNPAIRRRIVASMRQTWATPAARRRRSEAMKKLWAERRAAEAARKEAT